MNYELFTKYNFQLQSLALQECDLFMADGSVIEVSNYTPQTYPTFIEFVRYMDARVGNEQTILAMAYHNHNTEYSYNIVINNKVDFITIKNTSNSSQASNVVEMDYYGSGGLSILEDGDYPSDYATPIGDGYNCYAEIDYEGFHYTLAQGDTSVYDFTNTSRGIRYREDSVIVSAPNGGYYCHAFAIKGAIDNLSIGLGTPFYDQYTEGYESGHNQGDYQGYRRGYNDGYEVGTTTGGVDANTHNAFGYIAETFNAMGGIFNLQVLPNVSLGLCVSIPLVLVLIMVIIRMVKK